MELRLMTLDDYENVYQLWINTPGMGLNDLDDSKEGIEKFLIRNPKTCFVAIKEGCIIGVILSGHDGRRGYIYHTSVATSERRHGIGDILVNAAISALEDEGITKVALVAFCNNRLGNNFWQKCGFTKRDHLIYRNRPIKTLTRIDT